jgi:glutaminyl-peptide cyclotransferase
MKAGTENNTIVRNYIISTLKALDWHVEEDSFVDETPIGPKNFTNVIATKDPTALRRVVLSAHFDSKYFPHEPMKQVSIVATCHVFRSFQLICHSS